jgi:hypothetical protein
MKLIKPIILSAMLCFAPLIAVADEAKSDPKWFDESAEWKFSVGKPSGQGDFVLAKDGDTPIGTLSYDFSNGGDYVQATLETEIPEGTSRIDLKARPSQRHRVTVRIVDATSQVHQFKIPLKTDWQTIKIPLDKRTEHWDGANDGKMHFPIKKITLSAPAPAGDTKAGKIDFSGAELIKQ